MLEISDTISGNWVLRWLSSSVNALLNDVISFLNQDKFPYLWPDVKDYVKMVKGDDNLQEELKFSWHYVYLHHPNPQVRKVVVELNAFPEYISEILCQWLVDPDEDFRTYVYKATDK